MQKSTTESASWQKPLHGIKINQNQPEIPLKSGVLGRSGGGTLFNEILCTFAHKFASTGCTLSTERALSAFGLHRPCAQLLYKQAINIF